MKLSIKRVGVIVGLVIFALGGLVTLQAALLRSAMELKEQAFRRNVLAALSQISNALSTGEALTVALNADSTIRLDLERSYQYLPSRSGSETISGTMQHNFAMFGFDSCSPGPLWSEDGRLKYALSSPQRVKLKVVTPGTGEERIVVDSFQEAGQYWVDADFENTSGGSYYYEYTTGSDSHYLHVKDGIALPLAKSGEQKFHMMTTVFANLVESEFVPIAARLDSVNVDSVISATLRDNGIDLDYAYGVINTRADSLELVHPAGFDAAVMQSEYRHRIFPLDVFAPPSFLALYFPGRSAYLWRQMGPLLGGTVILMMIIIGCFGYTIRTIVRQRRFSTLMVDFINNMTHEFKTPISTVALASEAISRPDVLDSPDRVREFNTMIQSENRRMRSQTEKILQMAALEEKEVELNLQPVDVHELLTGAVESLRLHVTGSGGKIACAFGATRHRVIADPVHLTNVIHNVLDNARKYSEHPVDITVRTFDGRTGLVVRVEDHGIGIKAEDRKRVFEKYFRVPTGNRHDVKGFGLGLSYVKMMVEAHGGAIALFSEPGEGTQVEITLPVPSSEVTG